MSIVGIVIIFALLVAGAGFPLLEVGFAVFAIAYGVKALSKLSTDNDQEPKKKKKLKIVEED